MILSFRHGRKSPVNQTSLSVRMCSIIFQELQKSRVRYRGSEHHRCKHWCHILKINIAWQEYWQLNHILHSWQHQHWINIDLKLSALHSKNVYAIGWQDTPAVILLLPSGWRRTSYYFSKGTANLQQWESISHHQ